MSTRKRTVKREEEGENKMKYPRVDVQVLCEESLSPPSVVKEKRDAKDCLDCHHFAYYFYVGGMQKVACLYPEVRKRDI